MNGLLTRREAIQIFATVPLSMVYGFENFDQSNPYSKFIRIQQEATWSKTPIGNRIVTVAREFLNTPYVGGTLELTPEACQIFFEKLDCVTFLEMSWAIANCNKSLSPANLKSEITKIRYRDGVMSDYWSRLHYTTDAIINHTERKLIKQVSKDFQGGVEWNPSTTFMSQNANRYLASKVYTNFAQLAHNMEDSLAHVRFIRIPVNQWQYSFSSMLPGDFIYLCTTKPGLDFSHVGIYSGEGKFMHASSSAGKVVEQNLMDWVESVKTCNGFVVGRAQ